MAKKKIKHSKTKIKRSVKAEESAVLFSKKLILAVAGVFVGLVIVYFLVNSINLDSDEDKNIAVLETNYGVIKIELFMDKSPITAGNFKEQVENGLYDGTRFHRVIKNFMIQGGDPNSKDLSLMSKWGTGGTGVSIPDEYIDGLSNLRGTIAMANRGPNTGDSQFFINVADNTFLDWDKEPSTSKHPVFGRVVLGMDIVDEISNVKTTGSPYDRPIGDVIITKAYMEK